MRTRRQPAFRGRKRSEASGRLPESKPATRTVVKRPSTRRGWGGAGRSGTPGPEPRASGEGGGRAPRTCRRPGGPRRRSRPLPAGRAGPPGLPGRRRRQGSAFAPRAGRSRCPGPRVCSPAGPHGLGAPHPARSPHRSGRALQLAGRTLSAGARGTGPVSRGQEACGALSELSLSD
ncbi:collagen alpha-1(I) chain-like [Lutra lutra]|uniref:collagen alpha-1(I) chain-like n=1 Tax=Lutra lutra TaxID=9657 RepID=UPI001FD1DB23|nr:collagen alpha-1(I) chain-like [Lutra lutra]